MLAFERLIPAVVKGSSRDHSLLAVVVLVPISAAAAFEKFGALIVLQPLDGYRCAFEDRLQQV